MLVGKHSNNIIALDRDIKFPATLALLGDQAHTVKVRRTNAPDRGKLLYRWVSDDLPPAKVWKEHPSDRHPALELVSTGRHAIIPPSQYDGGDYELTDLEYGIRDLTPAELDGIWLLITGDWFYPKPKQDEPKATVDVATYRDAVKAAWPLAKILQHFGRDQAGTVKERGETRVLGNGGLLLSADGATWFCFAGGVGGDALDLWSYCATGKRLDRNDKRAFWDTLNTMADAAGIARPERQAKTGDASNTDQAGDAAGLPVIIANNRQLADIMVDCQTALAAVAGKAPLLYFRAGRLVSLAADERGDLCLLYTSPSPRDRTRSRMPSSA